VRVSVTDLNSRLILALPDGTQIEVVGELQDCTCEYGSVKLSWEVKYALHGDPAAPMAGGDSNGGGVQRRD
jgi:hypothetical protein